MAHRKRKYNELKEAHKKAMAERDELYAKETEVLKRRMNREKVRVPNAAAGYARTVGAVY